MDTSGGLTKNQKITIGVIVGVVLVILLVVIIWYYSSSDGSRRQQPRQKKPTQSEDEMIPDEDMKVIRDRDYESPDTRKMQEFLGYGDNLSWNEVLKTTELDPATFTNHQDFVKDVRRFSSGANFTSVTDDNTNAAFTNFVGLRRPSHVDIGASARQQPDIDQSVLKRNGGLRWGYSAKDSTYLTAEQAMVPAGQYQFENNVNYG